MRNGFDSAAAKAQSAGRQYVTFFVSNLFFGVNVLNVQEVLRYQNMTPVPQAMKTIKGLINLRGEIVTAVDLRRCLQLHDRGEGELPVNVIVRGEDGAAVSLLADAIEDVIEVSQETFEPPPETLRPVAREIVDGVYKLDSRLLLVVSVERLLKQNEMN